MTLAKSATGADFEMEHDPQALKAARCLIDLYGADAANVAEKRAMLSGKRFYGSSAPTWRRIARHPRPSGSSGREGFLRSVMMTIEAERAQTSAAQRGLAPNCG